MDYSKDEMRIHSLFPTPIGETVRKVTSKEKEFFEKLQNEPRTKNQGNTFTQDNHVLDKSELYDLKIDLTDIVNNYFKTVYKPKFDAELYITISWVNYTETKQWHHAHSHSNSIISGVYYIETDESDRIFFNSPNVDSLGLKIKSKEFNHWNSSDWWWETPKDNVLLFPSSLVHRVEPTTNKNVRVSLAFNTFIRGTINDELVELAL